MEYESTPQYVLSVSVTDSGSPANSSTATVTLDVIESGVSVEALSQLAEESAQLQSEAIAEAEADAAEEAADEAAEEVAEAEREEEVAAAETKAEDEAEAEAEAATPDPDAPPAEDIAPDPAPDVPHETPTEPSDESTTTIGQPETFDPRMKREVYRVNLAGMADELVQGGGVTYIRDENEVIIGRTPSENPSWFQSLAGSEAAMSVKQVRNAVEKALRGQPLGVRWWGRHAYDLRGVLAEGRNTLEVEVTTVAANYARSLKDNPAAQRWAGRYPPISMGLVGPVQLVETRR